MAALHNYSKNSDLTPSAVLPPLPKEICVHIFSFFTLSQKRTAVQLSNYYKVAVIEQTKMEISFHYPKLLRLFVEKWEKKYDWTCYKVNSLLYLSDLISPTVSNLNTIRANLAEINHKIALELQVVEKTDMEGLIPLVDAQERPRLLELFKLVALYRQPDEYMDQGNLKEAENAALKISDILLRSTKLMQIVKRHGWQSDESLRVADLISDPQTKRDALRNPLLAQIGSGIYSAIDL